MSGYVAKVHTVHVAHVIHVFVVLCDGWTGSGARQGVSGVLDSLAEKYTEVLETAVTVETIFGKANVAKTVDTQ